MGKDREDGKEEEVVLGRVDGRGVGVRAMSVQLMGRIETCRNIVSDSEKVN